MNILFIEDEITKQNNILGFLENEIIEKQIEIRSSIISAMAALRNSKYDLILLDMSLPLYDINGGNEDCNEFEAFGGIEILDEIQRKNLKTKVIVITAFDVIEDEMKKIPLEQLDEQMKKNYSDIYTACIHYDQSSLEWKDTLRNLLRG